MPLHPSSDVLDEDFRQREFVRPGIPESESVTDVSDAPRVSSAGGESSGEN